MVYSDGIWNDLELPWEETAHALTSLRGREVGLNPGFLKHKDGGWCIKMLFETINWKSETI